MCGSGRGEVHRRVVCVIVCEVREVGEGKGEKKDMLGAL